MKTLPDIKMVKKIASKVRKATVQFMNDYYYNNLPGISDDLNGWCAISSHALHTAFQKNGIESRLVVGFFDENGEWESQGEDDEILPNHCWVEIPFHFVDITATQYSDFENVKVRIVSNDNFEGTGYYPLEYPKNVRLMQGNARKSWAEQAPRIKYTREILKLAGI